MMIDALDFHLEVDHGKIGETGEEVLSAQRCYDKFSVHRLV